MKLILLVTAVALSASAYAQVQIVADSQTEVAPSYTTEPVTRQVAHCPDGYQLQRWEEGLSIGGESINLSNVHSPGRYYPVLDAPNEINSHPDKCVKLQPIYGVGEQGRIAGGERWHDGEVVTPIWDGTSAVTLPGFATFPATGTPATLAPTPSGPYAGQTTYGIWIGDGTGSTSGQIDLRYGETTYPVSFPQPGTSFKGDLWIRQSGGRTIYIPIDENTTLEFIPSK